MKDFYRAAIKIIIIFLIAAVIINDGVAIAMVYWKAPSSAQKIAEEAQKEYRFSRGKASLEELYAEAQRIAEEDGVNLDVWRVDQGEEKLTVTVTKKIERALVVEYIARYVEFVRPYLEATSTKVVDFKAL